MNRYGICPFLNSSNQYEDSYACIQKCKSYLRGDLGGIKALSGVVSVLDSTQDLLCKKLTNHFVSLCLDLDAGSKVQKETEENEADADDEDEQNTQEGRNGSEF